MTEKEFVNLKVGDKVWIITDWFNETNEGMKAVKIEIAGKDECKHTIQFVGGSLASDHCYLTKVEAWEEEVKECESAVKAEEDYFERKRQILNRYKSELAKAKEEEEKAKKVWIVNFRKGDVLSCSEEDWERSFEYDLSGQGWIYEGYIAFPTKQEAYEALAEYYKGKYEEALSKACDVRYFPGEKVYMYHHCRYDKENYGIVGYTYDGLKDFFGEKALYPSRQEAELERRKKND